MRHVHCANCGADSAVTLTQRLHHGLAGRVVLCRHCGLAYQNPQPEACDIRRYYTTTQFYEQSYNMESTPSQGYVEVSRSRGLSICEWVRGRGISVRQVLDIGCGFGITLATVKRELGCHGVGVEPAPGPARYAVEKLGLDVRVGMFAPQIVGGAKFDLIILMHVLEHTQEPVEFLSQVRLVTTTNGISVVEVPNMRKRDDCRGLATHFFSFPHLYYFTLTTLQSILGLSGWEVISAKDSHNLRVVAKPSAVSAQYIRDDPRKIRLYLHWYQMKSGLVGSMRCVQNAIRIAVRKIMVAVLGERVTRKLLDIARNILK